MDLVLSLLILRVLHFWSSFSWQLLNKTSSPSRGRKFMKEKIFFLSIFLTSYISLLSFTIVSNGTVLNKTEKACILRNIMLNTKYIHQCKVFLHALLVPLLLSVLFGLSKVQPVTTQVVYFFTELSKKYN